MTSGYNVWSRCYPGSVIGLKTLSGYVTVWLLCLIQSNFSLDSSLDTRFLDPRRFRRDTSANSSEPPASSVESITTGAEIQTLAPSVLCNSATATRICICCSRLCPVSTDYGNSSNTGYNGISSHPCCLATLNNTRSVLVGSGVSLVLGNVSLESFRSQSVESKLKRGVASLLSSHCGQSSDPCKEGSRTFSNADVVILVLSQTTVGEAADTILIHTGDTSPGSSDLHRDTPALNVTMVVVREEESDFTLGLSGFLVAEVLQNLHRHLDDEVLDVRANAEYLGEIPETEMPFHYYVILMIIAGVSGVVMVFSCLASAVKAVK